MESPTDIKVCTYKISQTGLDRCDLSKEHNNEHDQVCGGHKNNEHDKVWESRRGFKTTQSAIGQRGILGGEVALPRKETPTDCSILKVNRL